MTRLAKVGLPFVTIGSTAEPHRMSWIDIDYAGLRARSVHHLADLGHRHVVLVNRSAEVVAAPAIGRWQASGWRWRSGA